MLDIFGDACTERRYSYLRLDGATPTNTRMGLVDRFNDPHGSDRNRFCLYTFMLMINDFYNDFFYLF